MNSATPQIEALEEEARDLDQLLDQLSTSDWDRVTAFKDWTVWDVVAHLHLSDHMGLTTLKGPEPFQALMKDLAQASGGMAAYARDWLGPLTGSALHERWRSALDELIEGLRQADPEVRLTWPGPGMKPRMFATARQMETWAHAWEIYDLLGKPRTHTDRIHNIATIGVRTYGWTFVNRKLPVPEPAPFVRLTAPSGPEWTWHDPQADNRISGDAVAFCQVVTQVRNIADTDLEVEGEAAKAWMAIAQCFAGPPADPPAPGTRG